MTTCLRKSSSFGLTCVSFVKVYQFVYVLFLFGFEGGVWDLNVSVPDHCLSFYFDCISFLLLLMFLLFLI